MSWADSNFNRKRKRSCHSCVCITMSGRQLASIAMLHTHNCGNSSSLFCHSPCSRCEQIILDNKNRDFWPFKATKMGSCGLKIKFRCVEIWQHFFQIFRTTLQCFRPRMQFELIKSKYKLLILIYLLKILKANLKIWKNQHCYRVNFLLDDWDLPPPLSPS